MRVNCLTGLIALFSVLLTLNSVAESCISAPFSTPDIEFHDTAWDHEESDEYSSQDCTPKNHLFLSVYAVSPPPALSVDRFQLLSIRAPPA